MPLQITCGFVDTPNRWRYAAAGPNPQYTEVTVAGNAALELTGLAQGELCIFEYWDEAASEYVHHASYYPDQNGTIIVNTQAAIGI